MEQPAAGPAAALCLRHAAAKVLEMEKAILPQTDTLASALLAVPAARMAQLILPECSVTFHPETMTLILYCSACHLRDYPTISRSVRIGPWLERIALDDSADTFRFLAEVLGAERGDVSATLTAQLPRASVYHRPTLCGVEVVVGRPGGVSSWTL